MTGWAVLATGALVASLLAVGASPAAADIEKVDEPALTSACVGDALGDQMFTDVSDEHAFGDAINCIAYYGITNGTGDGSTFSPNDDVTRAEMAVFIARAAGVAGVNVGSGSGGFDDIGDVWQEAQDAINGLASSGMISSGGDFRPMDAITRAEMASFLIGLLAKAAPNVTIDSNGVIQLGSGGTAEPADDHFADARATVPAANDAEISALYELGVTKGASAAAVQDDTKAPLDTNYEPAGTVNRGQMAAFITRALAHTSARPAGLTAQFDGADVVVSVRDDDFQPMANVVIDVFHTDTNGVDLAFRGDGSCGEVDKIASSGQHLCEIDGSDQITGSGGDQSWTLVTETDPLDEGGTTVWAWTGDDKDTVDDETDLYRLDIPETAATPKASLVRVSTDLPDGKKAHLGSSVLYTVQLENARGAVTGGLDGKKPASYIVNLATHAYVGAGGATAGDSDGDMFRDAASILTPVPLTTNSDGMATFSVSAPPDRDPNTKGDKWRVVVTILANPDNDNTPAAIHINKATTAVDTSGTGGVAAVRSIDFSTERSVQEQADITVSVDAPKHAVARGRDGAGTRVTATVTDQYNDPITGVRVSLASTADSDTTTPATNTIDSAREFAVGRDGSYTFGFSRSGGAGGHDLTVTMTGYDHDGDGCSAANIADSTHRCNDLDGDGPGTTQGTAPLTQTGTGSIEWAAAVTATNADSSGVIREFDTDTNTIYAGADDAAVVLTYDSNDRYNVNADGTTEADADPASYAGFEKALADGKTVYWDIDVTRGSRAVNVFTVTNT